MLRAFFRKSEGTEFPSPRWAFVPMLDCPRGELFSRCVKFEPPLFEFMSFVSWLPIVYLHNGPGFIILKTLLHGEVG